MRWSPRSILSLFSNDLAIDLGTANTLVYVQGKGIVVREPSIIAVNQTTGNVEAVGKEAKEIQAARPTLYGLEMHLVTRSSRRST